MSEHIKTETDEELILSSLLLEYFQVLLDTLYYTTQYPQFTKLPFHAGQSEMNLIIDLDESPSDVNACFRNIRTSYLEFYATVHAMSGTPTRLHMTPYYQHVHSCTFLLVL